MRKDDNPYREEAIEKYGKKAVINSEERFQKLGKDEIDKVKATGEKILKKLAKLIDSKPSERKVQLLVSQYHQYLESFTEVSKERFLQLGELYITDQKFINYYEKYAKGLAVYLNDAIKIFCQNWPKEK